LTGFVQISVDVTDNKSASDPERLGTPSDFIDSKILNSFAALECGEKQINSSQQVCPFKMVFP